MADCRLKTQREAGYTHYRGQVVFMVAGRTINRRKKFKKQNL